MDKLERIKQLIKDLNNASYAYYNQNPKVNFLVNLHMRLVRTHLTLKIFQNLQ